MIDSPAESTFHDIARHLRRDHMQEIGIGIIGSGFMGLTYSEAITSQVNGAKLVGVTGGRRATQLAAEYGVVAEESIEALVDRPDVDAVVVATPDQHRVAITEVAAAAGKHVLVEKPMAPTVAECDRMIAVCNAADVNLGVVQTERFRRLTRRAKEMVDQGAIGPIRMMRTVSAFPINLTRELFQDRRWMEDPASGGLFMGMASHNTDFLRWISGLNAIRVFAQVATFSDIAAPAQSVMAQIVFESGVMAHMWISSELPGPSLPSSEVRFQIIGADGMLDFENFEFLDLGRGESWERVFTPEKFDYLKEPKSPIRLEPHARVLQSFVDSILEQRPPAVGGAEGRAAVEICEACLISARTGQAVDLPLQS
ncbi:MAG: Gfo/Idh/MocA family oxidoreductase [Planctomycetaceae bacterium]|nr:Gfo/Idh/MocA family oxidoreductase [Planctomycetaceae bacterium]